MGSAVRSKLTVYVGSASQKLLVFTSGKIMQTKRQSGNSQPMVPKGYRKPRIGTLVIALIAMANCLLVSGAILAPHCILQGAQKLGSFIGFLLSFICHQYQPRCLELFGVRTLLCARCFGFYASMMVFASLYLFLKVPARPISLRNLAVLVLPLVIDGTAQLLGFHTSTNEIRVVTGVMWQRIFVVLLSFYLSWLLLL
jgi:uncharacterized membrane protein